MCDLHLVIVISSHTHILVSFFYFLVFYMVESSARLVSGFLGFVFFFTPLFSFISFIPF